MYIGVNKLIAHPITGRPIQELSVQEVSEKELTLGSVPPNLCSRGSDLSSDNDSALALELSKYTVSGSTITANTAELTDISIKELDDDIVSYTNNGNEVDIDSPVEYVGLFYCYLEPPSIVADKSEEQNRYNRKLVEQS